MAYDTQWRMSLFYEPMCAADAVLEGLVSGLSRMAASDPDKLDRLLAPHVNSTLETVCHLLLNTWLANPERYANQIADFLLANPERLDLGYNGSSEGQAMAALSRRALMAIMPRLPPSFRGQVEVAIRSYHPEWEQGDEGAQGMTEYLLLHACGEAWLSPSGVSRLRTLQSRFAAVDTRLPKRRSMVMSAVTSPIPEVDALAFTDDEWLAAMRAYPRGWEDVRALGGTAVELSRVLEKLVATDRLRFAHLLERMGSDINPIYHGAILEGLCGSKNLSKEERQKEKEAIDGIPTETFLRVLHHVHGLGLNGCGREVCHVFLHLADRKDIPLEDLRMLERYAVADPDPANDSENGEENLYFHGYNSVRGVAGRAIAALLFEDYERASVLFPYVQDLVRDRSMAVRTCAIDALLAVLKNDRETAVTLFLECCREADAILGCETFERFVSFAARTHYQKLAPLLEHALKVTSGKRLEAVSRRVCVAAFDNLEAEFDAAAVRTGNEPMRTAAAQVYARNVTNEELRATCERHLGEFFNDPVPEVRHQAASCFHDIEGNNFSEFGDLINAYIESKSFPTGHDLLLHRLVESTWRVPGVLVRLASRFIEACATQANDLSHAAAGDAPTVAKLLIRVYSQSKDESVRSECLDRIDDMERLQFYGIARELEEIER